MCHRAGGKEDGPLGWLALAPHPELSDAFEGMVGAGVREGRVDFPASQGKRATHRKRRKSTPKNVSRCSGSCGSQPPQRKRRVG